jgi:hypothetical protein
MGVVFRWGGGIAAAFYTVTVKLKFIAVPLLSHKPFSEFKIINFLVYATAISRYLFSILDTEIR